MGVHKPSTVQFRDPQLRRSALRDRAMRLLPGSSPSPDRVAGWPTARISDVNPTPPGALLGLPACWTELTSGNVLYYGDNLDVLRQRIAVESLILST
jgi:hypothetical protein